MRYAFAGAMFVFAAALPFAASAAVCPSLSLGSSGAQVTALQTLLHSAYSNFPTPTGYFGSITQAAVKQWQSEHNIVSSGTPSMTGWGAVGPRTAAAMKLCSTSPATQVSVTNSTTPSATARTLSRGMSGPDVFRVQQLLAQQDLLSNGSVTGYFGPLTEAAVQKFQSQKGIVSSGSPATTGYGAVGPKTSAAIAQASGLNQSSTNTPGASSGIPLSPTGSNKTQSSVTTTNTNTSTSASCTQNGVTVASGASQTFYSQSSVASGSLCSSVAQSRTCTNGVLSGSSSYLYASCTAQTQTVVTTGGQSCTLDGVTVPHFSSQIFYSARSVAPTIQCSSVALARTCNNGTLSGSSSYQYAGCSQAQTTNASCNLNGATITSGQSVTAYQSLTVASGSSCVSESRACTNGTLSGSFGHSACTVSATVTPSGAIVVTDPVYGAKGDCTTDDTAAFQKAVDAAYGPSGLGKVTVPATASCYLVSKINGTNRSNVIIEGVGDQSIIKVNGSDSAGNWWDLSGSSEVTFRDLKIAGPDVVPKALFLWAWSGGTLGTGLVFDHVNIDAKSSAAHLYAFGYNGFSMRDSTWYQRGNGVSRVDPSLRTSIVRLDNVNSFPISSAYVTLGGVGASWNSTFSQMNLIDSPTGFGNGNRDNNAAFICVNCGAVLSITGGQMTSLGETPVVIWNFAEGITFDSVTIGPPDHSVNTMGYAIRTGGSPSTNTTGNLTLKNIFFIGAPIAAGAYVGTENPGPGGMLALGNFQFIAPDIGNNANNAHLMAPTGLSCTAPVAAGWLSHSRIDAVRQHMVFCGNADLSTTINAAPAPGQIITPVGTTQNGCKFRADTGYSCNFD